MKVKRHKRETATHRIKRVDRQAMIARQQRRLIEGGERQRVEGVGCMRPTGGDVSLLLVPGKRQRRTRRRKLTADELKGERRNDYAPPTSRTPRPAVVKPPQPRAVLARITVETNERGERVIVSRRSPRPVAAPVAPHRHKWNVTGAQPNGATRTCSACGTRQTKTKGRWND